MASYSRIRVNKAEIDAGVERAAKALAPDVVRIRYSLGEDWTGVPSIFFRVVLSDDASREERLHEAARRAARRIEKEVDPDELGLNSYPTFRSLLETLEMKEAEWE